MTKPIDPISQADRQDLRTANGTHEQARRLLTAYEELLGYVGTLSPADSWFFIKGIRYCQICSTPRCTRQGGWIVCVPPSGIETKPTRIVNLRPVDPIASGMTFLFAFDVHCRNGNIHYQGAWLHTIRATTKPAFGEIGQSGVNWVCATKLGTSIWTTLEQCISRGLLIRCDDPDSINYHGADDNQPNV